MTLSTLDERIRKDAINLNEEIQYQSEGVVSKTLIDTKPGTLTIFAFDQNQGLSEHSAPFDAFIHLLEGEMEITIGGNPIILKNGQSLIMPANIPHALRAIASSKMMLVMIRA